MVVVTGCDIKVALDALDVLIVIEISGKKFIRIGLRAIFVVCTSNFIVQAYTFRTVINLSLIHISQSS